ncbi:MAG: OmpA family protein [Candidatus Heimdallarchaeota archaeon]
MRTKNIILATVLSLFSIVVIAQTTAKEKNADRLFKDYSYTKAIAKYLSITDKGLSVKQNLAEGYYHLNDFANSQKWSEEVMKTTSFTPEDVRRYAYILRINEDYPASENAMNEYYGLMSSDSRAIQAKNKMNSYPSIQKDRKQFSIKNLKMNGPAEEFGPNFYKGEVVFASSRGPKGVIGRKWNGNNYPYLNFFRGTEDENMELNDVQQFFKKKNKKWHEGPVSFNEEGTYMVYTRNNYKGTSSDKIRKLMMFTSEFKDGAWAEGTGMTFNSPEYSVGHGSLSPDGKTMYFASDMPGGQGGIDIYKITRSGDTWSEPMNLGPKVNTEGREMFPFIDYKGKTLFFASDGHYGLGGLDLFMSSVASENFGTPRNIGFPINGSHDDFAMIIDENFTKGYFSSNRPDGHGDDDIYSFKMLKPFCKVLKGTAKDEKTLEALGGVNVNLYDKDGEVVETVETTDDGKFEFCIDDTETYALKGTKESYTTGANSANMNTEADEVIADLLLGQAPEFTLYDIVTDRQTGAELSNVKCTMTDCDGKEEVFYTSAKGDFTKELNNKLNDEACFKVLYEKAGYESKTVDYNFVIDHPGQYNIAEQLAKKSNAIQGNVQPGTQYTDPTPGNTGGEIAINPIYFDLDRCNIRPDAKVELDKIVKLMTQYPNLVIELSSHTDCRARKKYNQVLSDCRAKTSLKYIQSRISNPSRITGQGYGESRLANGCACEPTNNSNCSDAEHQENRRTEFVIVSQ